MFLSLLLSMATYSAAGQTMSCNDNVQISVDPTPDGSCTVDLTADMVLEGPNPNTSYLIEILQGPNVLFSGVDVVSFDASAYLGGTYVTRVTDLSSNNKCWGSIHLEDKAGPVVNCTDLTIPCTEEYETVPFPSASDNCDPNPTVQLINIAVDDDGECSLGQVVVSRTFKATDDSGNESLPCVQEIIIERPDFVDFPNDIMWECTQYDNYSTITNATALHPSVQALQVGTQLIDATGITSANVLSNTGSGIPGGIEGEYCNYNYTSSDQPIDDCGNTFKIIRTWTVLDWCTGNVITSNPQGEDNVQVIKVVDSTPPTIVRPPFTVSANISGNYPNGCVSQGFLPPATISDNCSSWTVKIFTPVGEANYVNGQNGAQGGFIPSPGLPIGFHQVTYQATDACGNIEELLVTIEVIDDIVPTAICDEITDVSLTSNGLAVVQASVFDDGSYDNCCLDEFLVRRMNGDCNGNYDNFGPTVEFCCSDIPNNNIMVIFRVVDCFGNFNDCMVEVEVEDKLPPVVNCPGPETITCDYYLDQLDAAIQAENYSVLDQFGEPTFYDNCEVILTENVSVSVNSCAEGTIIRTWTVDDPSGNGPQSCSQTIFIQHVSDWVVEFPASIDATCLDGDLPDFGEPEIFHDECEMIGTSFDDQYFYIVPDACFKIVRTWTVVNWCIYEDYGYDVYLEANFAECNLNQDWDGDGDKDCRTFRDGYNTSGTPGIADGYIEYKQTIKVIDEDAPVFTIPAIDGCIVDVDCDTDLLIPYPDVTDLCSPTFEVDITGDFGVFNNVTADITIPNVGPGTYDIFYSVTDNCGNVAYDDVTVVVEDCKNPTPYCKNGLIIEIMQTGMVDIWASDFNDNSFDNCPGDLLFSFSSDVNDVGITFTCDDLGQNPIEMWVTDASGNQDFCVTTALIQDNMNVCGQSQQVMVAGLIENEAHLPVGQVMVELNNAINPIANMETTPQGTFEFPNVDVGYDYTITPSLDDNPVLGVTTLDMVYIMRHIQNIEFLDSPYKIIAADANHSETVTTLDLVEIRKVILQVSPGFPNNTSWRFVDMDFEFPNPANPFASDFPEVINLNNLSLNALDANFMAIKVGDVNLSAIEPDFDGGLQEHTANETMPFYLNDRTVKAGEQVLVEIYPGEEDLLGVQFTLELSENLSFVELMEAQARTEHYGRSHLDQQVLTVSWDGAYDPTQPLFAFQVIAKADGQLSDWLAFSSRFTAAEAYTKEALVRQPKLIAEGTGATVELYQNQPNPFSGRTQIDFYLPIAGKVDLKVQDISGKVVLVQQATFEAGRNSFFVNRKDLKGTGVWFYTLTTGETSITKKMVSVE